MVPFYPITLVVSTDTSRSYGPRHPESLSKYLTSYKVPVHIHADCFEGWKNLLEEIKQELSDLYEETPEERVVVVDKE